MTSLERTLVKAQSRRRVWFTFITFVAALFMLYFFELILAILLISLVSLAAWDLLTSEVDTTNNIIKIKQ
jgi:hypothetical protein